MACVKLAKLQKKKKKLTDMILAALISGVPSHLTAVQLIRLIKSRLMLFVSAGIAPNDPRISSTVN